MKLKLLSLSILLFMFTYLRQIFIAPDDGLIDQRLMNRLNELGGDQGALYFKLPSVSDLEAIPQDPKNPLTIEKIELGKLLFHETALGTKPLIKDVSYRSYTCATCHHAGAGFQVAARQSIGDGGMGFGNWGEERKRNLNYREREIDVQMRKSPTILNSAFSKTVFWDGQFGAKGPNIGTELEWREGSPSAVNHLGYEGLESQAIAAFDVHRLGLGEDFFSDYPEYVELFDSAFPNLTETERYSDLSAALAIAAYERTLLTDQAPFQKWLNGERKTMSRDEKKGALLFFGEAGCVSCHSSPALGNNSFHALGMGELKGTDTYQTNGFKNERLGRGGFTRKANDMYKFKTPQLYNLANAAFFGHGATFISIGEVVQYINRGEAQNKEIHFEQLSPLFRPLNLTADEVDLITLFLTRSLYDPNVTRYAPEFLPSKNPFPLSDTVLVKGLRTDHY